MRLALREMRRRASRFVTATAILTLIALLLMFLGGLLDGLIANSTNAIRAQPGELLVFSSTSRDSFLRSRIEPDTRAQVEAVPGVDEVGGLAVVQLGARVPGNGERDLADVALFGYELAPDGVPPTPADGTAYADSVLKSDGVEEGMTLLLGPARTPVTILGFVDDTQYQGQGSLWASLNTWAQVTQANRPAETLAPGVVQSLVVHVEGSVSETAEAIEAATGGEVNALTITEAIDAVPGVTAQRSTFTTIIGVTALIALVVVALFFTLLTVERTALYGVLKAIGARSRTLFAGVVVQATIVAALAAGIAAALGLLLDAAIPPGALPYDLTVSRIVGSTLVLLVAAVAGSAFSLRRVLKIDPASAIGSTT